MKTALGVTLLVLSALSGMPTVAPAAVPEDVIARVGDEVITFHDLDVTINSTAMVGMPIPGPGTPERTEMRLTLLDKAISADLLYLDALHQGLDRSPVITDQVESYSDVILGSMYRDKYLVGDLVISDQAIRDYFDKAYEKGTPFTQDVHMAIEAVLRQAQFRQKIASLRERLRKGVTVKVFDDRIDPAGDAQRKTTEVVATIDDQPVEWGDVRQLLAAPVEKAADTSRRVRLDDYIDEKIMTRKARESGIEQEASYQRRLGEFRKTLLVNSNRAQLEAKNSPSDEDIRQYYANNRAKIALPELRKVQMLVVKSRDEADRIRQEITSGKLTLFQAAAKYSLDPNAKMNLGELGWVAQGTGFPELDKATFALKLNTLSEPVQSPAGWHLVQVQDMRTAQFQDIDDRNTWTRTRRMLIHEREDDYVVGLRKNNYPVKVYDDVFSRLTQQEVDAVAKAGKEKPVSVDAVEKSKQPLATAR
jgi:peptidyl-prolyl cis-trans isomerase C